MDTNKKFAKGVIKEKPLTRRMKQILSYFSIRAIIILVLFIIAAMLIPDIFKKVDIIVIEILFLLCFTWNFICLVMDIMDAPIYLHNLEVLSHICLPNYAVFSLDVKVKSKLFKTVDVYYTDKFGDHLITTHYTDTEKSDKARNYELLVPPSLEFVTLVIPEE